MTLQSEQDGGFVISIIDVRDPVCNAPAPFVGGPTNWFAPMYHNELQVAWTRDNLGAELFGLALDDAQPPNIYVLPTMIYNPFTSVRQNRPQEVWKIDGITGAKTVLATLHTGNDATNRFADKNVGLGQVAYHRRTKQLYVTSFADGWIYRLDAATGNVLSTFDPPLGGVGTAYNAANDTLAPIGFSDRIWGVQVHYQQSRLYYGTWVNFENFCEDNGMISKLFSVALDATTGDFVAGSERLDLDFAVTTPTSVGHPIADIAFSSDGKAMMVGERAVTGDGQGFFAGAYRFNDDGVGGWTSHAKRYEVGSERIRGDGRSCQGGVDFSDCATGNPVCNNGDYVMATANGIQSLNPTEGDLYGLQILPADGGERSDSYAVDFDEDLFGRPQDIHANGDVEVVRGCIQV